MALVQSACAALPVTTGTVEEAYSCSVFSLQGCCLQLRADLESRAQEVLGGPAYLGKFWGHLRTDFAALQQGLS